MATESSNVKCTTCDTEKPNDEFRIKLSKNCLHERTTCHECFVGYIESKVADGQWENIDCCEQCTETIDNCDIPQLLFPSPAVLERFDKLALTSLLSETPDFQYCLSPSCSSGQMHLGGADANPIFKCQGCGTKFCLIHRNVWHENMTCSEYDIHGRDIKASEETVKLIAKECPGCHRPIEKNDGCDHMTCSKCNHEFCYFCLVDYKLLRAHDNSYHNINCRYHTNNLP